MNVEQLIVRTLKDRAATAVPPAVDTQKLRRSAIRGRNRLVSALTVAAVTAVAVVSVVLADPDPRDTGPVDGDAESSKLEGPVWGDHDGLHAGSVRFRVETFFSAIGVVEGGLLLQRLVGSPSDQEPPEVLLVRPGEEPRVVGRSESGPMGDPNGPHAAWFEGEELVVLDTSTGAERLRLEVGANRGSELGVGARVPILFLDDDEVLYAASAAVWRLALDDPAAAPQRLGGPQLLDAAPGVRVLAEVSSVDEWSLPRRATRLDIEVGGRSVGSFGPVLAEASLSPDSRFVATTTEYRHGHRLVVLDSATARPVRLPLPDLPVLATGYPYGWVGDHTLVVGLVTGEGRRAPKAIFGCDVAAARCDQLSTTNQPTFPF